jgi:hypothetical protein
MSDSDFDSSGYKNGYKQGVLDAIQYIERWNILRPNGTLEIADLIAALYMLQTNKAK